MKNQAYLLDTHTFLWAVSTPDKLSPTVREIIQNGQNRLFVSGGTLWEMATKESIGKLVLPDHFFDRIFHLGYESLTIDVDHLEVYRKLPMIHRDPFDRLLVAQATSEQLCLLSCDEQIQRYDVKWMW